MSQHPDDPRAVPGNPAAPHGHGRPQAKPRPRDLPRYRVVLHSDAFNDLMFVVHSVMEITRLCKAEATHKMWQAHHTGQSVLLVTYRERAELYVEQFASKGLKVTIEPVA